MKERQGKEVVGVVVSNKMDKTAVVEVTRLISHPIYGKVMKDKCKYVAHDEKNRVKIGDKVQIKESRPISKTKRWRIVEVLKA
jgi:small subunit ribosomal protein S17